MTSIFDMFRRKYPTTAAAMTPPPAPVFMPNPSRCFFVPRNPDETIYGVLAAPDAYAIVPIEQYAQHIKSVAAHAKTVFPPLLIPAHEVNAGAIRIRLINCATQESEGCVKIPDEDNMYKAAAMIRALDSTALSGVEMFFLRKAIGFSVEQFADITGHSLGSILTWESKPTESTFYAATREEKLLRHTVCALLCGYTPSVHYDPLMIIGMRIVNRPDNFTVPTIELRRIVDYDNGAPVGEIWQQVQPEDPQSMYHARDAAEFTIDTVGQPVPAFLFKSKGDITEISE